MSIELTTTCSSWRLGGGLDVSQRVTVGGNSEVYAIQVITELGGYKAAPSLVVLASVWRMYGSLGFANPMTGAVVSLLMISLNAL